MVILDNDSGRDLSSISHTLTDVLDIVVSESREVTKETCLCLQ